MQDMGDPDGRWAMVLTPREYNQRSQWLVVARVTWAPRGSSLEIPLGGEPVEGAVLADDPFRLLQARAQLMGQVRPEVLQQVLWTLEALLINN